MEIISEIISSLAWPVAAVWIAHLFRGEVKTLLGRISAFKYKELEAKFERGIETAKAQAKLLNPEKQKTWDNGTINGIITTFELFNRIAITSPRAAIIEYWIDLEAAISAAAKKAGIKEKSTTKTVSLLIENGSIPAEAMPLFSQLKELRNQAVHLPEFSVTTLDAQNYLDSMLRLGNEFRHYAISEA